MKLTYLPIVWMSPANSHFLLWRTRKLPFIPSEKELDDLIVGCGKKAASFRFFLKETAMRCGEATCLEWTDIDFQRRTITLNKPEKNGKPGIFKVSKPKTYSTSKSF